MIQSSVKNDETKLKAEGGEPSSSDDRDELPIDEGPSIGEGPSIDEVFDILKNERRRLVLSYIRQHGEATVGDLAIHVAAIENDKDEAAVRGQERKRVYISLYQSHLPRMKSAGAIEYDSDRGTITPTSQTSDFYQILQTSQSKAPRFVGGRSMYYLALGLVGIVAFLSTVLWMESVVVVTFGLFVGAVFVAACCDTYLRLFYRGR